MKIQRIRKHYYPIHGVAIPAEKHVWNANGKRLSIFIKHFYEFGNKSEADRRVLSLTCMRFLLTVFVSGLYYATQWQNKTSGHRVTHERNLFARRLIYI